MLFELKKFIFKLHGFNLLLFGLKSLQLGLRVQHLLPINTVFLLLSLLFSHDFIELLGQLQDLPFQSPVLLDKLLAVEFLRRWLFESGLEEDFALGKQLG